ncbi:MAG TPA: hypothetical protein VN362_20780 [Xanthobacteraceae bacterium]|nr:hypothetical protein [Xanthobacteraceae bacterium]
MAIVTSGRTKRERSDNEDIAKPREHKLKPLKAAMNNDAMTLGITLGIAATTAHLAQMLTS